MVRMTDMFERHEAAALLLPVEFTDGAKSRRYLRDVLDAIGVKVTGKDRAVPDDRPHVLVVHTHDYRFVSTLYAVPEEAVTEPLRTALRAAPECFAAPDDAYLASWGDVLRLLAVWGLDGLGAEQFHEVMVEDFGGRFGNRDLPGLEELAALGNAWAGYAVATVEHDERRPRIDAAIPWLGYHYRSMHAFRQSM